MMSDDIPSLRPFAAAGHPVYRSVQAGITTLRVACYWSAIYRMWTVSVEPLTSYRERFADARHRVVGRWRFDTKEQASAAYAADDLVTRWALGDRGGQT